MYKVNFHKVSKKQEHQGELLNAHFQARVWISEEGKKSKDKKYKIVSEKMAKKYPKFSESERKEIILRYL